MQVRILSPALNNKPVTDIRLDESKHSAAGYFYLEKKQITKAYLIEDERMCIWISDHESGVEVELPESVLEKYKEAWKLFDKIQCELCEIYDDATIGRRK